MASIPDRDRLLRNEKDFIDLKLTVESDSNLLHTAECLRANSTIKNVTVTIFPGAQWEDDGDDDGEDGIAVFFRALGGLPSLKELRMVASRHSHKQFLPMKCLAEALRGAKNLELLSLHGLQVAPTPNDINSNNADESLLLATSLEHLSSLKEFSLIKTKMEAKTNNNNNNNNHIGSNHQLIYDNIFMALSKHPILEEIVIRGPVDATTNFTPKALASLFQCPTLRELDITQIQVKDSHFIEISKVLLAAERQLLLETFVISGTFGQRGSEALAEILKNNTVSSLKTFQMNWVSTSAPLDSKGIRAIAAALERNDSLETFSVTGRRAIVTDLSPMVEMMRVNTALKLLEIETLNENSNNQQLSQKRRELHCYLKLNRAGRQRLLRQEESVPRSAWVATMTRVADHLDCLFVLLMTNPMLCQSG